MRQTRVRKKFTAVPTEFQEADRST